MNLPAAFFLGVSLLYGCASLPAAPKPTPPAKGCVAPVATRALAYRRMLAARGQPPFTLKFGLRTIQAGVGSYPLPDQDENWNHMYGFGPVIWVKEENRIGVLDLRAEFPSSLASQVFADERSGRVIVFFEKAVEGPEHAYAVWISLDRGDHWFRGADLPRPVDSYPPASLENFFLDRDGRGTAWLKSVSDSEDSFYRATTLNCGLTWSAETLPAFTNVIRAVEQKP